MQNTQDTTNMTLTSSLDNLKYPDSVIGHWRSARLRALLPYRSELARDYIMVLDYDPLVSELRALPFALDYYHNGIECEFMPDAMFVREGDATLAVCLPYEQWLSDAERIGLGLATSWCMEHLCNLQVITPTSLGAGPYLRNIRLLANAAKRQVAVSEIDKARNYLAEKHDAVPIHVLARYISDGDPLYGATVVLNMAYWHLVELPMHDEDISPNTVVWLPGNDARSEHAKSA